MPEPGETQESRNSPNQTNRIKLADIEFPSDALSVKRFRVLYPELFDEKSTLNDGYSAFFEGDPHHVHLRVLTDLIDYERTLADYAFYSACSPESLDGSCHEEARKGKEVLEQLYQQLKLADSPETARLLIRGIEEQGAAQGMDLGKGRPRS